MVWTSSPADPAPARRLLPQTEPAPAPESLHQAEENLQMARALGGNQPILVARIVQLWVREQQAANLASVEACAILLLLLGEKVSAEVFMHLNSAEVENLGSALLTHSVVSRDRLNQVVAAFLSLAKSMSVLASEPKSFLRNSLLLAFGERQAQRLEAAIVAHQGRSVGDILQSLSDQAIADQMRSEPFQVAAVMLAQLATDRAAAVIKLLDQALALELLSRLAQTQTIPAAALLDLRDGLVAVLAAQDWAETQPHTGPHAAKAIADLLHPQGLPAGWAQAMRSRGPGQNETAPT